MAKVKITKTPNMGKVKIKGTPEMRTGGDISSDKAKEILHDGTIRGKPITDKQRKYFGAMSSAQNGRNIGWQPSQAEDGLDIGWGGNAQQISSNPYTGNTIQFNGASHDNGGIGIAYNGKPVEVEGDETAFVDRSGDMNIMGNMPIPGTKTKFKNKFKEIANDERLAGKQMDKGMNLINSSDPYNKYQSLSFNSGIVKADAAKQKQKGFAAQKEALSHLQNSMLDLSNQAGIDPKEFSSAFKKYKNGGMIPEAGNGMPVYKRTFAMTDKDAYDLLHQRGRFTGKFPIAQAIEDTANKYGIDPRVFARQIITENPSLDPARTSGAGAKGIMQFMKGTGEQYGIDQRTLTSSDPNDMRKVIDAGGKYLSDLANQFGGDQNMAFAAYNWGPGNLKKYGIEKAPAETREYLQLINPYNGVGKTNQPGVPSSFNQKNPYLGPSGEYLPGNEGRPYTPEEMDTLNKQKQQQAITDYQATTAPGKLADYREAEKDPYQNYYETLQGRTPQKEGDMATLNTLGKPYDPSSFKPKEFTQPTTDDPIDKKQAPKAPSLSDKPMGITEILPELATLFDRPTPVPHLSYKPDLYTPYQVSLQDRLNDNNSTFRQTAQTLSNNPEALAILAADKYNKDNSVHAEQFRMNQQIRNDIGNQNTQLLNQAQLQNLQMQDQQATRQAQAIANTDANKRAALQSLASKFGEKRKEDMRTQIYEAMSKFRMNDDKQLQSYNPDEDFKPDSLQPGESVAYTTEKLDKDGNVIGSTRKLVPATKKKQAAMAMGGRLMKKMKY